MHKNIGKCIGGFPLYSIIREASDWSQIHASVNPPLPKPDSGSCEALSSAAGRVRSVAADGLIPTDP